MNNLLVVCFLSLVLLGALVSHVDSLFPVDLIRVVLLMPATPVLTSPAVAWGIFLLAVGVLLISFYIGLPRQPMPKPIRRRSLTDTPHPLAITGLLPQTPTHFTTALDMFAQLDVNDCFSRFLCYVGATPTEERTTMQNMIYDFILTTGASSAPWNLTDSSPRRTLVDAANFGLKSKCWNCCPTLYHSCPLSPQQLLLL